MSKRVKVEDTEYIVTGLTDKDGFKLCLNVEENKQVFLNQEKIDIYEIKTGEEKD